MIHGKMGKNTVEILPETALWNELELANLKFITAHLHSLASLLDQCNRNYNSLPEDNHKQKNDNQQNR